MKIEVRYYTRGGNTRRLAEAVAKALDVEARTVDAPMDERADVMFLCASVYGGMPEKSPASTGDRSTRGISSGWGSMRGVTFTESSEFHMGVSVNRCQLSLSFRPSSQG